jgi:hypothetical protein
MLNIKDFQTLQDINNYADCHNHILIKTTNNIIIYCFGSRLLNTYKDVIIIDRNFPQQMNFIQIHNKIKVNPQQVIFSNRNYV